MGLQSLISFWQYLSDPRAVVGMHLQQWRVNMLESCEDKARSKK